MQPKRILIVPQSFKGSAHADVVAAAIARGFRRVWPTAEYREIPLADGGEGTVRALVHATHGQLRTAAVHDPLGRPIEAEWGMLGTGSTAVIEMAAASGLPLLAIHERDARITSTRGTGELILQAVKAGARRVLIGIGGSATNDGGAGMARALGYRFIDGAGADLAEGGAALARLARVEGVLDSSLHGIEVEVACDVRNPLTGQEGASAVYGPQKGASREAVEELDRALGHYADVVEPFVGRSIRHAPGAGAAGGLGAGLIAFLGGRLRSGADLVLDAVDFDRLVAETDLVVTGEGRLDAQSAYGKLTSVVAARARRAAKPAAAIVGSLGEGHEVLMGEGLSAIAVIGDGPASLEVSMAAAEALIEAAAERFARAVQVGAEVASVNSRE